MSSFLGGVMMMMMMKVLLRASQNKADLGEVEKVAFQICRR